MPQKFQDVVDADSIAASLPVGLVVVDRQGTILRTNRYLDEMLGYPPGQLSGRPLELLVPAHKRSDHVGLREEYARAPTRRPMSFGGSVSALHRDGSKVPVEVGLSALPGGEHFLAVVSDVTDVQKTRQALLYSQKINKTGSWTFDFLNDTVYWSPELFRILGIPPASTAPPYETQGSLFSPESWTRIQTAVERAIAHGEPYEFEVELANRDADGPLIAIARGEPELDADGRVVLLAGTLQDVTDLVRARRERDSYVERFRLARANLKMGVFEWDVLANKVYWDAEMYDLYGVAPAGVGAYAGWLARLEPSDAPRVSQTVTASLASKAGHWENSFRIVHPERGIRHIQASAKIIRDPSGNAQRLVGLNWDVTRQVQLEAEVRRTQKIESLGILAGGIAHDFNNLLTSILGRAELLEARLAGDRQGRKLAREITASISAATQLTSQLLTFSAGGEPVRAAASLEQLVRDTAEFSLHGSRSRLEFDFAPGLWGVEMDTGQIAQVVQNLVLNADQAMPNGGAIRISARNAPNGTPGAAAGRRYVELRVADQGPGVPEDLAPRIFDPFFSTKPDGRGLGLAISYSIVQKHGGVLELESSNGRGAAFQVSLPAADKLREPKEPPRASPRSAGHRILLVDDMEDVRKTMRLLLEATGCVVEEAESVDQAIELYDNAVGRGEPPALVFTDLTIPGGRGGLELEERLHEQDDQLPIVLISGFAADSGPDDAAMARFAARLRKPVTLDQLRATVAEVVG